MRGIACAITATVVVALTCTPKSVYAANSSPQAATAGASARRGAALTPADFGRRPVRLWAGFRSAGDSARVRAVQRHLRAAGYRPGPVDGHFGARTERALRQFQRARGLRIDGIVGARTFRALVIRAAQRGDQGSPQRRDPATPRWMAAPIRARPDAPSSARSSAQPAQPDALPRRDGITMWWYLLAAALGCAAMRQVLRRRRPPAGAPHGQPAARAVPVFYDTRDGRRWRIIRIATLALLALGVGVMATLGQRALRSPLTAGPAADLAKPAAFATTLGPQLQSSLQPPSTPGSAKPPPLAALDPREMPLFGDGVYQRIVKLQRRRGRTVAADLFTGRIVHWLSAAEERTVGRAEYAFEHYGILPDKQLALTFDDGPDRTWTPRILDLLARYKVQATFFVIGSAVAKDPELTRRIVREGHVLGSHTFTHGSGWPYGPTRDSIEMALTDRVIRAVSNRATRLFRNPYGGNDIKTVRQNLSSIYTAQKLGYQTQAYDLDSNDWQFETRHLKPTPLDLSDGRGHVVLLHDGGGDRALTYTYLERTIKQARRLGYGFTTARWVADNAQAVYRPVRPSTTDRATLFVAQGVFRWVDYTLVVLFVVGVIGMLGVALLNVCLAFVHERRGRRQAVPARAGSVTVAIAAYNEETVIERTLRSVLASTGVELEVLVVNDGSTDGTREILDRVRAGDPRVRAFHVPNGGKGDALNLAFREASHDRVVTFDADTIVRPDTVARLVRHFEQSRVVGVAGLVKVGNVNGVLTAWQALEYISSIGVERTAQSLLGTITVVPGACAAWRRREILAVGGFTTDTLAEDCDLTLKLQRAGGKIVQDNTALAFTEAPQGLRPLLKQRFRWSFGNLQALWKHRSMMFRPRHGLLGMVVLPYTFVSLALPIIFLPLLYSALATSALAGGHTIILIFAALFTLGQGLICFFGLLLTRSSLKHLLVVPLFRIISEPLRIYLLYKSLFAALKGRAHGWNKLARTGTVAFDAPLTAWRSDPPVVWGPPLQAAAGGSLQAVPVVWGPPLQAAAGGSLQAVPVVWGPPLQAAAGGSLQAATILCASTPDATLSAAR